MLNLINENKLVGIPDVLHSLRACIRHILYSVGPWVLFFPVVALGQVHAPNVQVHTDVHPWDLLNPLAWISAKEFGGDF